MSFLQLQFWPLYFVAFLPLALYLWDRYRAPSVEWPAMRFFLHEGRRKIRTIHRRDLFILAARTLVLILIATALLRPRQSMVIDASEDRARFAAAHHDVRRGIVLAIDTSYSMAFRAATRSRLEVAQKSAERLLRGLLPADRVVLLEPGSAASEAMSPSAAREALQGLRLGGSNFSISRVLELALASARLLGTPSREIFIFTDLSPDTAGKILPARLELLEPRRRQMHPAPSITWVDLGNEDDTNHFISSFQKTALVASVDETVDVLLEVEGGQTGGSLTAKIFVDDRQALEEKIELTEDGRGSLRIPLRFSQAGLHLLRAEIEFDHLREDDVRHLNFDVRRRIDVTICETQRAEYATGKFVYGAIWPDSDGRSALRGSLRPTRLRGIPTNASDLGDVAVLCDLDALSAEEVKRLEEHVRSGGGLLIFTSPGLDLQSFERFLYRGGRGLAGARLSARLPTRRKSPYRIRDLARHPVLNVFRAPEIDLSEIAIFSAWSSTDVARNAKVLARLDGEHPWLIESTNRRGKVLLVASSASYPDSDFVETPLFPPFIDRALKYAALGDASDTSLDLGETVTIALDPEATRVIVTDPDGRQESFDVTAGNREFIYRPQGPGDRVFELLSEDSTLRTLARSVHIPTRESRLRRLTRDEIASLTRTMPGKLLLPEAIGALSAVSMQVHRELWPYLIVLASALLLMELVLLRGFSISERHSVQPARGERRSSNALY